MEGLREHNGVPYGRPSIGADARGREVPAFRHPRRASGGPTILERVDVMAKDRVVLAYSGGLDTSICIKWLQEQKDLDVVAVMGNVGQEIDDMEEKVQKARDLGAIDVRCIDMREEFVEDCVAPAIVANAMYENKYPLLSALSRPIISKYLVEVAHEFGAKYIAHGCTGKGNDQVRFETSIMALDPDIKIIAPVREWDLGQRPSEIAYAKAHGIPLSKSVDSTYSIDDNLWGRAIECGVLEDPWNEPPEDVWTMTVDPAKAPDEPTYTILSFEGGKPCAIDGEKMSLLDIILKMNKIAGDNGYGRIDMIENRYVGVKSRECYEVPAGLAIIEAHKALEDLTLERDVLHSKLAIEQDWAVAVYNGKWYSPYKDALDAFLNYTQTYVTGDVRLKFFKGSCTVVGLRSPYSLYDHGLITYDDEGDTYDQSYAEGFIALHGLSIKTWASHRAEQTGEGLV